MKGIVSAVAVVGLVVLTFTGFAQDRRFEFMAGGGIESPISPSQFNDMFNLGITGKIAAGYFITPQLTVGANVSYNRFSLDKNSFLKEIGVPANGDITLSGGELSVFEIAGVAKYYLMPGGRSTNFYFLGGPGVAYSRSGKITVTSSDGTATSDSDSATDLLLTGGIGMRRNLSANLGLFIEGRYSYVFTETDNTSYMPLRIGLIF